MIAKRHRLSPILLFLSSNSVAWVTTTAYFVMSLKRERKVLLLELHAL